MPRYVDHQGRAEAVLKLVVEEHIVTAEPVSSEHLRGIPGLDFLQCEAFPAAEVDFTERPFESYRPPRRHDAGGAPGPLQGAGDDEFV